MVQHDDANTHSSIGAGAYPVKVQYDGSFVQQQQQRSTFFGFLNNHQVRYGAIYCMIYSQRVMTPLISSLITILALHNSKYIHHLLLMLLP